MTTMSVKTFLAIAPKLPSSTSLLLRGNHGIGKSQLGRQLALLLQAKLNLEEYEVIDRRLSQVSEGDIIGLPSTDGNVTRFNPPDWYKTACTKPCFLFLDELNRATPEVMQAAFQIVLDRELNGWKLHPETRVMSAVNSSAAYNVNEVDPALLDRFWVIDLTPSVEDWLNWARSKDPKFGGNLHSNLTDFIQNNEKFLDPPKNPEPGSVHPSRRSWERLNNALCMAGLMETPTDDHFYSISLGYVGTEASIAFTDFVKAIDNQITGEEVVNKFDKIEKKLDKLSQEKLNMLLEKVAEFVTDKLTKLTEKQGESISKFMQKLPAELRVSFWTKLTKYGVDKIDMARQVHKYCAKNILDIFEVPMGEAGVGVVPNIPGVFQQKDKK